MASFRAVALNALLRATMKKIWKPDLDIAFMRKCMSAATALLSKNSVKYSVLATPSGSVDYVENDTQEEESLTLFYLHGGAFCWHNPAMYRGIVARMCKLLGASSGYLLDYRLAPEHQFPAAVSDCIGTYRWLLEQPGVDPRRLVLAGDSAGGNLLLTTLMQARDQGLPLPACAVAMSPFADATGSGSSVVKNAERDVLFTTEALNAVLKWYLPESADLSDPLVSPLLGDLTGLPPLLLQAGETEMLRDDSVRIAEKIVAAGGIAKFQVWDGMSHTFQLISWLPESQQAFSQIADFVHQHVAVSLGKCLDEQDKQETEKPLL